VPVWGVRLAIAKAGSGGKSYLFILIFLVFIFTHFYVFLIFLVSIVVVVFVVIILIIVFSTVVPLVHVIGTGRVLVLVLSGNVGFTGLAECPTVRYVQSIGALTSGDVGVCQQRISLLLQAESEQLGPYQLGGLCQFGLTRVTCTKPPLES